MKRLALTLVLMTSTTAYAQWQDEPFVIPEPRQEEGIFEQMRRERDEESRRLREREFQMDQEYTNQQIRDYIREQRERQEELESELAQREFRGR